MAEAGFWLHLYKSGALGSYDKPGLLSRLSRARGIFNEGGDPGRAGMELLKRFCKSRMARRPSTTARQAGLSRIQASWRCSQVASMIRRRPISPSGSLRILKRRLVHFRSASPAIPQAFRSRGLCGRIIAQEAASMLRLAANSRIDASCGDGPSSSVRLTKNCQSRGRVLAFLNNVMASRCDGGLIF